MPRRRRRRTRKPLVTVGGRPLTRELAAEIVGQQGEHFDRPLWEVAVEQLELFLVPDLGIEDELRAFLGEARERYAEFDTEMPPISAKERSRIDERIHERTRSRRGHRKQNRGKRRGLLRARADRRRVKQTGSYPGTPLTIAA